jgi:hypothetical protein
VLAAVPAMRKHAMREYAMWVTMPETTEGAVMTKGSEMTRREKSKPAGMARKASASAAGQEAAYNEKGEAGWAHGRSLQY